MSNECDLVKEIEQEPRGLHIHIEDQGLLNYWASCNFDEFTGHGNTPREALNDLLESIDHADGAKV